MLTILFVHVGQSCTKQNRSASPVRNGVASTKGQIRTKNTITYPNFLYMPICLLQALKYLEIYFKNSYLIITIFFAKVYKG